MGVLGQAVYLFPYAKIDLAYWFRYTLGTVTWPMWGVGLVYLGIDLLWALLGAKTGIGHLAHLGGAVAGFALAIMLLGRRDSEVASEAKAILADIKDYSYLSRLELETLAASESGPKLALAWMSRSLRDPGDVKPGCLALFQKHLSDLMGPETAVETGQCLAQLTMSPGTFNSRQLLEAAAALEQAHDFNTALTLYERVLRLPNISEPDFEGALMRGGLACERTGRRDKAKAAYNELIRRDPMGPLAEQARLRLKGMASPPNQP